MAEELNRLMGITDDVALTAEAVSKAARETHRHVQVAATAQNTYVIVVAVHQDTTKNFINKISCKKGIPIGGYVYDAQSDAYYIDCADFLHLGFVPLSFEATMNGVDDWRISVPMPESVIKKYLSSMQKKELKNFKNHFSAEFYSIHYIQIVDPN